MAIGATHRLSDVDPNNGTSFTTTSSVTMTVDELILMFISVEDEQTPTSVASTSVTFSQIGTGYDTGVGDRIMLYGAIPTSTVTETIAIDFSTSRAACGYSIIEVTGADTSSTVANAIVQSAGVSSASQQTSASITLSAFGDADNRCFAGFFLNQRDDTFTAGTDFTILGQDNTTETHTIASEWRSDAADTGPDISWTTPSHHSGIAVEVKVAVALSAPSTPTSLATEPIKTTGNIGSVTLTWTHDENNSTFLIQHTIDSGSTWVPVGIAPAGARSFVVSGLNTSDTHTFRVAAFGDGVNQTAVASSWSAGVGLGADTFVTPGFRELNRVVGLSVSSLSVPVTVATDDQTLLVYLGMEGAATLPTVTACTWDPDGGGSTAIASQVSATEASTGTLFADARLLTSPTADSGTVEISLSGVTSRLFALVCGLKANSTLESTQTYAPATTSSSLGMTSSTIAIGDLVTTFSVVETAVTGLQVNPGEETLHGAVTAEGTSRWLGVRYERTASPSTYTPAASWNENQEVVAVSMRLATTAIVEETIAGPLPTLTFTGYAPDAVVPLPADSPWVSVGQVTSTTWTDVDPAPADTWTDIKD